MKKKLTFIRLKTSSILFWIQERLYCTQREAVIFLSLVILIFIAHGMRILRANISPFDDAYYASSDSLFNVLSARADSLDSIDSLFTSTSRLSFQDRKSMAEHYAEVELYIMVDTLEKPLVHLVPCFRLFPALVPKWQVESLNIENRSRSRPLRS